MTFFIFLLGRIIVNKFNYIESLDLGIWGLAFYEEEIIFIILICIYISLLALFIGYFFMQKIDLTFLNKKKKENEKYIKSVRTFSISLFFVSMIFRFINLLEMKEASEIDGYYESFSTFTSSLPTLLLIISRMFDVAFFAYLSTNPTKKKAIFPILIYLSEGLLAIFSGRRSIFMLNLLLVIIYFSIRSIKAPEANEKKWIGKFEWIFSIISFPILISVMNIIEKIRGKNSNIEDFSFLNSIFKFFHSQGISVNLIGYTETYKEIIPKGKFYTFGPLFEFVDDKILRPLRGLPELWGQTKERAMEGYLFTHTISFIIMPTLYLKGVGYGSSFIAELYNDFSFIGVFIGSIIYGAILYTLYYIIRNSHFVLVIFALLMTRAILFAPRAATLSFIVSAFTLSKVLAVIIILIGSKLLYVIQSKSNN